jgi:hypothetical protein
MTRRVGSRFKNIGFSSFSIFNPVTGGSTSFRIDASGNLRVDASGNSRIPCFNTGSNVKVDGLTAASSVVDTQQLETDSSGTTSEKVTQLQLKGSYFNSKTLFIGVAYALTSSSYPSAYNLLQPTGRAAFCIDSNSYSQIRLKAALGAGLSAGSTLRVKYYTANTTTVATMIDVNATPLDLDVSVAGSSVISSSWVDLVAGAKGDSIFFFVLKGGGDGVSSCTFSRVNVEFR